MSVVSSIWSPRTLPQAQLERLLSGREALLDRLVGAFQDTVASGGGRYELLVGPRGAGKSHLVGVLLGRLDLPGCQRVVLGEEEHLASNLALLARMLQTIDPPIDLAPLRGIQSDEAERRALRMLDARVPGPLLLVIENLGDFLDAIGPKGQHRLRALLQERTSWSVLASSTAWTKAFSDPASPFYRHFNHRELGPLSAPEAQQMLVNLAVAHADRDLQALLDGPSGLARVRSIQHILGGSPRAMAMVYPHLDQQSWASLEVAFHGLADAMTPYFQERVSALRAAGQRALLTRLADCWSPQSATQLADHVFSSHQTVTKQLSELRRAGLVQSLRAGRHSFFQLSEPLWRLARSMKNPDGQAQAFIRFVTWWTPPDTRRPRPLPWPVQGEYDREMADAFDAVSEGETVDWDQARDIANRWWAARPGPASATAMVRSLGQHGTRQEFEAFVEHILGRFPPVPEMVALAWSRRTPLEPRIRALLAMEPADSEHKAEADRLLIVSSPKDQHQADAVTRMILAGKVRAGLTWLGWGLATDTDPWHRALERVNEALGLTLPAELVAAHAGRQWEICSLHVEHYADLLAASHDDGHLVGPDGPYRPAMLALLRRDFATATRLLDPAPPLTLPDDASRRERRHLLNSYGDEGRALATLQRRPRRDQPVNSGIRADIRGGTIARDAPMLAAETARPNETNARFTHLRLSSAAWWWRWGLALHADDPTQQQKVSFALAQLLMYERVWGGDRVRTALESRACEPLGRAALALPRLAPFAALAEPARELLRRNLLYCGPRGRPLADALPVAD